MTLKVRRILSLIFILLFLIIAPATILYAAGYRLGRNLISIQRTGMFIIESQPKGAKIFINGKAQKTMLGFILNKNSFITTPAKIKNLLPGEYDLGIELDGYWSWQKKLNISPGASTFAKDIYLFKNNQPIQIASTQTQNVNFSPDKKIALAITKDQLTFINLYDGSKNTVHLSKVRGENISWSEDGQKLVIDNYLFALKDLTSKINLHELTPGSFNFKWTEGLLYYQDKFSLYRFNGESQPEEIISNMKFNEYLVKNGYLYLITNDLPAANLKVINLASKEQLQDISLPNTANYSFINEEKPLLNLYDGDHKILYLINPPSVYYSPIAEIISNVKSAYWYSDNDLLYADDFEIWLYNLESKEKTLITRISDTINDAVMHPNKNYIIYSTNKGINAVGLDERGKRNITELARFGAIGSFIADDTGETIYFSGQIGNTEGLYKFLLQ